MKPTSCAAVLSCLLLSGASPAAGAADEKAAAKSAAPARGVSDTEIGLNKTAVTSVPAPVTYSYGARDPGDGKLLPRLFPAAPPLIPHTVEGLLPITRTDNGCVACHAIDKAGKGDPVPIPASHYYDLRNAPAVKRAEIAGSRWVCTSCHVPQTDAGPLLKSTFKP